MAPSLEVGPARPDEWAAAFHLLFQYLPPSEQERRASHALQLAVQGELHPGGIFVARRANRLRGAVVGVPLRGAGALLWPPQTVAGEPSASADELLRQAMQWLQHQGAKMGQVLLQAEEAGLAAPLERNGLIHLTRLLYLRRDLEQPVAGAEAVACLDYQPYSQGDPTAFHETLLRSYEATLDCPEVNGVRDLPEILEGHRAQGAYHPEQWWLAWEQGRPAGVLIMTEVPEHAVWEVAYVGIVPERRGRGLGRILMTKALLEIRGQGAVQLTLTVDGRNRLAMNLYRTLGFEQYDEREVYLAIWKR